MMLTTVYLAAEDVPGLAVGRRLVAEQRVLSVYRVKLGFGFGNLKKKAPDYDQMGKNGFPVLMLTDLDTAPCPSGRPSSKYKNHSCLRTLYQHFRQKMP